jgi:hypothetical protein
MQAVMSGSLTEGTRQATEQRERAEESRRREEEQRQEIERAREKQERQEREAEATQQARRDLAERERAERMEQWKRSGMPRDWVLEHLDGWDQPTWAALTNRVKSTTFWPLNIDEMAAYLEGLRDELRAERDRKWEEQRQREAERMQAEEAARKKVEEDEKREDPPHLARLGFAGESVKCERCKQEPRVRGERFCKECRKAVLAEMKEAGYFMPAPSKPRSEEKGRKAIRPSEWFSHQAAEDDYGEESRP